MLKGDIEVSPGFNHFLERKGGFIQWHDTPSRNRAVLSNGDCSVPVAGDVPDVFGIACRTHDLAYDIMRYYHTSGPGGQARNAADELFHADMLAVCDDLSWFRQTGCVATANWYYIAVSANSIKQGYGVP
jgi:hypothetical protein